MALKTPVITKAFPTKNSIGFHLLVEDDDRPDLGVGDQVVIDRDIMENFTEGGATTEVKLALKNQAQGLIDEYKDNRTKWASSAYGTMITQAIANITVVLLMLLMFTSTAKAALTITSSNVTDWTAVAEGAHSATGANVIDISLNYVTHIQIQAFLDQDAQAHEGTEFIIQISQKSSGDEDWSYFTTWTGLDGTPNIEPLPGTLNSGAVTDDVADTGGLYETATTENPHMGRWLAIEDTVALAASELIWQTAFVLNTSITWLDGTTNTHLDSADFWDIAMSETRLIPAGVGSRARVIINNSYDADGTASSLNYKVNKTVVTGL